MSDPDNAAPPPASGDVGEMVDWLKHVANYDTPQDPRKACRAAADRLARVAQEQYRLAMRVSEQRNDILRVEAKLEQAEKERDEALLNWHTVEELLDQTLARKEAAEAALEKAREALRLARTMAVEGRIDISTTEGKNHALARIGEVAYDALAAMGAGDDKR